MLSVGLSRYRNGASSCALSKLAETNVWLIGLEFVGKYQDIDGEFARRCWAAIVAPVFVDSGVVLRRRTSSLCGRVLRR